MKYNWVFIFLNFRFILLKLHFWGDLSYLSPKSVTFPFQFSFCLFFFFCCLFFFGEIFSHRGCTLTKTSSRENPIFLFDCREYIQCIKCKFISLVRVMNNNKFNSILKVQIYSRIFNFRYSRRIWEKFYPIKWALKRSLKRPRRFAKYLICTARCCASHSRLQHCEGIKSVLNCTRRVEEFVERMSNKCPILEKFSCVSEKRSSFIFYCRITLVFFK